MAKTRLLASIHFSYTNYINNELSWTKRCHIYFLLINVFILSVIIICCSLIMDNFKPVDSLSV